MKSGLRRSHPNLPSPKTAENLKRCTICSMNSAIAAASEICFPRGTRIHRTEPDDFQWDVYFVFEHVEFPDGSTGSGAMLHFTNWYGAFDIHFNGETHVYQVSDQERWGVQVLDTIQ